MASKLANMHKYEINQLCYQGEKVIDSEAFRDLQYIIGDGHITLSSGNSGNFTVRFDVLDALFDELKEIREIWGDIKTKKCLL